MGDSEKSKGLGRTSLALAAALALLGAPLSGNAASDDPAAAEPGHALYSDPGAPDISGMWLGTYTTAPGDVPQVPVAPRDITHWAPWPPPLTPDYQKQADVLLEAAKKGRALGDLGARCLPFGMPVVLTIGVYQYEIIQTPGEVSIWIFGNFPIVVWTDGRGHPKDLKPSYNGHSTGYWEGDTLHVDTVGILPETPIGLGATHSAKLHMKWTIQRVADDVLHMQITLFDEDAFTEPMVTTELLHRKQGQAWAELDDGSCWEKNQSLPANAAAAGFRTF